MRKVVFLMHVSLDGFVARPNGDMDWIVYNDDLEKDVHSLHPWMDTAIYGRVTYQLMEGYWPGVLTDPNATPGAMEHAQWVDKATKIVFSRTLDKVDWKNTVIIHDNIAEEMAKLKQQPGKNMWLLGSPSLAHEFMRLDLIDEYRLNVNPVILGKGIPLFAGLDDTRNLRLLETKTLSGGIVVLRYEPERN